MLNAEVAQVIKTAVHLDSINELKKYGFIWLTGEVDPYSLRVLIDLTEQGKQILEQFLGVTNIDLPKNWNHSDEQQWSFTMPHGMKKDLMLFILFHVEKCDAALKLGNGYVGYYNEEYLRNSDAHFVEQLRWNPNRGKDQNFNTHAMSGRNQL